VGGKPCTITGQNVTTINATTPMDASIAGSDVEVALVLANGTSVISTDNFTVEPPNMAITGISPGTVKRGDVITISGIQLNEVTTLAFRSATCTGIMHNTGAGSIIAIVPADAPFGKYPLTISAGTTVVTGGAEINVTGTEPVTNPALVIFDFEDRDGNNAANNAGGWGGIANGKSAAGDGISGDFFEITANNWSADAYWWVADNWIESPYPTVSGLSSHVIKMDVRLRQDIPYDDQVQIRLRISNNTEIDFIPFLPKENSNFTTYGEWTTITIPCEGTALNDPTLDSGDWGIVLGYNPNGVNFTGFCVDNIRYESK
jgi:hypothetical protein